MHNLIYSSRLTHDEAQALFHDTAIFYMITVSSILLLVVILNKVEPIMMARKLAAYNKSMLEANARYGVQMVDNDVDIFKKLLSPAEGSKSILGMKRIQGPRGDNTIDLLKDGVLIRNISLEDTKGDWVLKSNGIELPRVIVA